MPHKKDSPTSAPEQTGVSGSRRHALSLLLGIAPWLHGKLDGADSSAALRFAISESVVGDVNMNDARAAMQVWMQRISREVDIALDPKLLNTTQEIQERMRKGQLDAVALNIIEYRPIADLLDPTQVVISGGRGGLEQYLILAKQNGPIRQFSDLKGRRIRMLKNSRMCVAPAWLVTLLAEGHHGPAEQFFASMASEAKISRVVLPVFFDQADACMTTKQGFETMCELNPQLGKELKVIASSPPIIVSFYMFRKGYRGAAREKLIKVLLAMRASPSGGQLAILFQFDDLAIRDVSCLASVLALLDVATGRVPGRANQCTSGRGNRLRIRLKQFRIWREE